MNKASYPFKSIASIESLAKCLQLDVVELELLSQSSDEYFFVVCEKQKANGTIKYTYDVKPKLKRVLDKIRDNILKRVDYPNFLKGSLKGISYTDNVKCHTNKRVIISEDIKNFFPSISSEIVYQVWVGEVFNFSHEVAKCLTNLVTFNGFVVQGISTSSFLANLAFYAREPELNQYCLDHGLTYTRYVDDITISSKEYISKKQKTEVISKVYSLLASIGVKPNRNKHSIMQKGNKQAVHRLNCGTNRATLPKGERSRIRSAVKECENLFKEDNICAVYQKLYKRTMGRVNHLKRLHPNEGQKLLNRLRVVKP